MPCCSLLLLVCILFSFRGFSIMRRGGTSETKPATAEVQAMCDQVFHRSFINAIAVNASLPIDRLKLKPDVEQQHGKTYDVFSAVAFKSQVVAGKNYFIKVHVGDGVYLHLRVYQPLPCYNEPLSLHSAQTSKTEHDDISYF